MWADGLSVEIDALFAGLQPDTTPLGVALARRAAEAHVWKKQPRLWHRTARPLGAQIGRIPQALVAFVRDSDLTALPPRAAQALRLRFLQSWSLAEIGRELGCTRQAVHVQIGKAIAQLRCAATEARRRLLAAEREAQRARKVRVVAAERLAA